MESLLRYFISAPPVPLSQKIYRYMPTDTRSVLKIVRTAAGGPALPCPLAGWLVSTCSARLPFPALPCPALPC